MSTATTRELPAQSLEILAWIEAGEEVAISSGGRIVARLIPEKAALPPQPEAPRKKIDWSTSAAFRDRTGERVLTAEESEALRHEAGGQW